MSRFTKALSGAPVTVVGIVSYNEFLLPSERIAATERERGSHEGSILNWTSSAHHNLK